MKLRVLALVMFCITTQAISQCLITSFTANISACDPADDTYTTNGQIDFINAPATGTLTVTDCDGIVQTFFPPFVSPTIYNLTGQDADGGPCSVTAAFSDAPGCDATLAYVAPFCPCNLDFFSVNIGTCDPFSDTYPVDGIIQFTSPPATGTLTVTVTNASGTYDTIINPPFTSPETYSITGTIPADGSATSITVVFSDDITCTQTILFTSPTSCFCPAELGTFTTSWLGPGSPNPGFLCWGDCFDITANGDFVAPYDAGTAGITYDPGINWLVYTCPPTVGLIPSDDPLEDVSLDPCLVGLINSEDLSNCNDPGLLGAFPPGTFTDNIMYFVPITMYSMVDGFYSSTNSVWPCYELGAPVPIQYIPEYTFTFTEDCQTGEAVVTANGGLPEIDGSFFTGSGLTPGTANLDNTTAPDGGTFTVSGLTGGDVWSFDISDDNGCPYTASGGPFPPLGDAGADGVVSFCDDDPADNLFNYLGATPVAGGTWAGPSALGGGSLGTFNPATMIPGVYTYNEGTFPCDSSAQVTVTVTPSGNAGTPNAISYCQTDAPANLLTVLGGAPDAGGTWAGPSVLGGGDLGTFDPATMTAGVYTYTVGTVPCDESATVTVTVDIPATADFEYGVYCADDPDPLPDFDVDDDGSDDGIGGTFTSTAGLSITAGTGLVDLSASTPGVYTVTNTLPASGACPAVVFTAPITINAVGDPGTPAVVTYCQTDPPTNLFAELGGTPDAGGTWAGPSVLGGGDLGTFDPATMTPGVYTYTAGVVPCDASTTVTVGVDPTSAADFEFATYCANDADPLPDFDVDDDGSDDGVGGTFSSTAGLIINAATGLVDLDASTPGIYTVTNTVTGSGVCPVVTFDATIEIFELPDVTISADESICDIAAFTDVQFDITAGTGPFTINYTLDGAPASEVGVAGPTVTVPAVEGTYALTTITDANGCTNTVGGTVVKQFFPTPVVDPIPDQELCDQDGLTIPVFTADVPGSAFNWTNTGGTDVGFGTGGPYAGNIGSFTGLNGTTGDVSTVVEVTATSPDGCVSLPVTFNVTVHPLPTVLFTGPAQGCVPLDVEFTNLTTGADNCVWEFGDGTIATGCGSVNHTYTVDGLFDVTLTVSTVFGCTSTLTLDDIIEVYPRPIAEFTADPYIVDVEDTEVGFENLSTDATSYIWDFGDGSPQSTLIAPYHTFPTVPGAYTVTLTALDGSGLCPDVAVIEIVVNDVLIFYVPNVFTPDGDDYNETFQPIFTSGYDKYDFHLMIFNRWGELIFESYDASKGWDGTYGNRGLVKDDVYVWKIVFRETMSDKMHEHYGHVTILK